MPFPLSVRETGVRMAAIPIAGIAGIKNVTETSAPEIGAPFASLSFTRIVLLPFRGGAGSVVSSIFVCGAFIAPADPAPGGGGPNATVVNDQLFRHRNLKGDIEKYSWCKFQIGI